MSSHCWYYFMSNVHIGKEESLLEPKIMHYAVCRYVPDILRDEFVNIGIVVHIPKDKYLKFFRTKNLSRIKHFDDEIESDLIKAMLESLEIQFSSKEILSQNRTGLSSSDFLQSETVFFVNQLQFSEIRSLHTESLESDINDLFDMYLYYDKKKSERIDSARVKTLVSKMFTQKELNKVVNRNPSIQNKFNQTPFDFSVQLGERDLFIKALSFDYRQENRLYTEIKSFLFDLQHFQDRDVNNIKVVINNTEMDSEFEIKAFNIMKEYTDVLTLEEFDNFISNNSKQDNYQYSIYDYIS
ncbi:hypothetical protein C4B60_11305 [Jeotgalibacillus proteolyticus]|uniref:DUF3037 domain-containing protein n=1 Tax=Jeotgalibacillus proteolyticus TaxID=2082395 RepID=A0A2S5GAV8_9BACL|nr:hypothetical protein C4B60_11305 [Jeotgalibacillus proteolyticus]